MGQHSQGLLPCLPPRVQRTARRKRRTRVTRRRRTRVTRRARKRSDRMLKNPFDVLSSLWNSFLRVPSGGGVDYLCPVVYRPHPLFLGCESTCLLREIMPASNRCRFSAVGKY